MTLKNRKVLVTGAGGFIGSHLCEALVQRGAKVRGFLRYTSRQDRENLEWLPPRLLRSMELIQGDLRDEASVRRAMKGQDVVFHLGALISVPYSFESPTEFVATNVLGTAHVLSAAMEEGVKRVVHTSTSEVFGTARYVPMDEAHPLQAQSPYAASKVGADKLAESFHRTYALPVVTLRPFNTFGPRQSLRAIVPTIVAQALKGDVISLGALGPRRDLTFVGDTIKAFLRAAVAPRVEGELINIGTGKMWSVSDVVFEVGRLLGKKCRVQVSKERLRPEESEVHRLQCQPRKAWRLLGWKAETSFSEGLRETLDWIRQHENLIRAHEYHV